MARARNIKPGFFKNEDLVDLPFKTRLFFIGLWTLADREGRLEDRPKKIKMELFPCDNVDVEAMISELHASNFVLRYEVENIKLIQVLNFDKHQRPHHQEAKSMLSPPPCNDNLRTTSSQGASQPSRSRSDSLIPDTLNTDSLIPDSLIADCGENTIVSTEVETSAPPKEKTKYVFNDRHFELAKRMAVPVQKRFETMSIDIEKWADSVRKLELINSRPMDQIISVWAWIIKHDEPGFSWADNIRTPMKLRQRDKQGVMYYEVIWQKMASEGRHIGGGEVRQFSAKTEQNIKTIEGWANEPN